MTVKDLTNRLEKYAGGPLISTKQICDMIGDNNRSRVLSKYGLDSLPRIGGKRGKFFCMDVAEALVERRTV